MTDRAGPALTRRRFLTGSVAGAATWPLTASLVASLAACGRRDRTSGPTTTAPPSGGTGSTSTADPSGTSAPPTTAPATPYLPPSDNRAWERIEPAEAGWDPAALDGAIGFAGERASRSVVVVTGGRIVAERQWEVDPGFARDVASVQKSVVAVLVGMAVEQGLCGVDDRVTDLVGPGWTFDPDRYAEARITLDHLLTMTSGLDAQLRVVAEPGTTWFYNTNAYHRTHRVLERLTGKALDDLSRAWLWDPIDAGSPRWVERPGATPLGRLPDGERLLGLVADAYDLARFGLLIGRGGAWGERQLVDDAWVADMLVPSQALNPSYGRLWWLNGQESHRRPGPEPPERPGPLIPGAPDDLVAALGAEDQKIYVTPSLDTVVTRLGSAANGRPLAAMSDFDRDWWRRLTGARS